MPIADSAPRPRTATELIDAAVALARVDYPTLLIIAGAAVIVRFPLAVLTTRTLAQRQWLSYALAYLLSIAISGVVTGAGVAAGATAYLGQPMDAAESIRLALRRAITLGRVALNVRITVALGLIALVFPGLLAAARFFAADAAVVLEDCDVKGALARSRELAAGNERRILGALLPAGVLMTALAWSGSTIASWLGARPLVSLLAGQLSGMVFWPIYYTLIVALYYDARIRNEAFDVALMLEEAPAPVA